MSNNTIYSSDLHSLDHPSTHLHSKEIPDTFLTLLYDYQLAIQIQYRKLQGQQNCFSILISKTK